MSYISSKKKKDAGTMSERVFNFIKTVGYSINKLPMPDKSPVIGEFLFSLKRCSYGGKDVNRNLFVVRGTPVWRLILEMILPPGGRPMTDDGKPNRAHPDWDEELWASYCQGKELWLLWTWIWEIINMSALPSDWRIQMQRVETYARDRGGITFEGEYTPPKEQLKHFKADVIDILSLEFVRLWGSKFHTTHNYPHILCGHLGDEIRNLAVDIVRAQTQGFEHAHQDLKNAPTNKAKPVPTSTTQVPAGTRTVKGKEVQVNAYEKTNGTR